MKSFGNLYAEFTMVRKPEIAKTAFEKGERIKNSANGNEKCKVIDALVSCIIKADGIISGGEMKNMEALAAMRGVSSIDVKGFVESFTEEDIEAAKREFKTFPDEDREDIVFILLSMASADGMIAKNEYDLVKTLCY